MVGALVKGGRQGWIKTIFERHTKLLGFQKYKGSLTDINSINGAEHHSAVEEPLNMISYNMELFNKQLQDLESAKLTTASSSNIFTYQQVMGEENARNVLPYDYTQIHISLYLCMVICIHIYIRLCAFARRACFMIVS